MPHIANVHSDNSVIAFNGRVSYCILMNYYQIIRCTSRVSCTTTPTGKNFYFVTAFFFYFHLQYGNMGLPAGFTVAMQDINQC